MTQRTNGPDSSADQASDEVSENASDNASNKAAATEPGVIDDDSAAMMAGTGGAVAQQEAAFTDTSDTPTKQTQTKATPEAPRYASPAERLAAQQRRKRARLRFSFAVSIMLVLTIWMSADLLAPDDSNANLSARPAPSDPVLAAQWATLAPMQRRHSEVTLAAGDTLGGLLARAGIDAVEADAALDALRTQFDVRRLKPGQKIRLLREWPVGVEPTPELGRFAGLDFIPQPRQRVIVRRMGHMTFDAVSQERPLDERYFLADSLISSSVYEAARAGGMAPNLVVELIRLFSFSIDFQRDIREGDRLEVLFTRRFDENNQLAEEGDIAFAALTNRGRRIAYWRLPGPDGQMSYFDAEGRSVQRLLMKTPVDGARLSSRFGMRRHPILGYTRLHRGLDFAAPRGTPIYAAGNGTITKIGRDGNNGKMIKIGHKNGYETAYLHMNGFARGMRKGRRVRQGQVIGYVGSTGLATGPHLHYEVLHYKRPVNPRELVVPSASTLDDTGKARLADTQSQTAELISSLAARDNRLRSLPRRRAELRR